MSDTLDLPRLLAPISDEAPAGTVPEAESDPYYDRQDVFSSRSDALYAERPAGPGKKPDVSQAMDKWREVRECAEKYLETQGKDLELVVDLGLSAVRHFGLDGIRDTFQLTTAMVEQFWDGLQPPEPEDDELSRIWPLEKLDADDFAARKYLIAIAAKGSSTTYTLADYVDARFVDSKPPEEQSTLVDQGMATFADLESGAADSPDGFYAALKTKVASTREAIDALRETLFTRVEELEVPTFSTLLGTLDEIEEAARKISGGLYDASAGDAADGEETAGGEANEAAEGGAPAAAAAAAQPPRTQTRDDALRMLETAAKWFEENEPQSILPFEIRKAARRGRMSPEELYRDLIGDDEQRTRMFKDIGLSPRSGDE